MNIKQIEDVKNRIKEAMEAASKFPRIELTTDRHDKAIQDAVKAKGFNPLPPQSLVRCRKLVVSGLEPQTMSDTEMLKRCASMPRSLTKVLRKYEPMLEGTVPLGEFSLEDKLRLTKAGDSKTVTNQRNYNRIATNATRFGPPPLDDRLRSLAVQVIEVMGAARCIEFRVYVENNTYCLSTTLQPWDQVIVLGSVK